MKNCTVTNFDLLFSDSSIGETPSISFSFLNCIFVKLKSVFRVENPRTNNLQMRFHKCFFDTCLKPFAINSSSVRLTLNKCTFIKNTKCFYFSNQAATAKPTIIQNDPKSYNFSNSFNTDHGADKYMFEIANFRFK